MTRICITGGPRTGKTTLAKEIGGHNSAVVLHTDSLIGLHDWSGCSAVAAKWMNASGPWVIEGVAVSRALRKWRDEHHDAPPPVDRVIFLREPHERLTPAQSAMAKGVATVHAEIADWLAAHGVDTEYR